jgi:hypothetical protein
MLIRHRISAYSHRFQHELPAIQQHGEIPRKGGPSCSAVDQSEQLRPQSYPGYLGDSSTLRTQCDR